MPRRRYKLWRGGTLIRTGLATAAAGAAAIGLGVYVVGYGGPDPVYYVATTGSDSNAGTENAPFLTLNKCYTAARPGQVCQVDGGVYGGQTIAHDVTKAATGGRVIFQPAPGETVQVGCMARLIGDHAFVNATPITVTITDTTCLKSESGANCTVSPCFRVTMGSFGLQCQAPAVSSTELAGCLPRGTSACTDSTQCVYKDGANFLQGALVLLGARSIEIRGFRIASFQAAVSGTDHVTNAVLRDGYVWLGFITSYVDSFILGGYFGDYTASLPTLRVRESSGGLIDGMVIDGTTFAVNNREDCDLGNNLGNCHIECLQLTDVTSFTLRRSTFRECAGYDILAQNQAGQTASDVTIENNFFGASYTGIQGQPGTPGGAGGLYIDNSSGHTWTNVTIQYNSFADTLAANSAGTRVNWIIRGNIGVASSGICNQSNVACTHNVWSTASASVGSNGCADTNVCDVDLDAEWVEPGPLEEDFHLRAGAVAVGSGDAASCPNDDIDGDARPIGDCDAGADERS